MSSTRRLLAFPASTGPPPMSPPRRASASLMSTSRCCRRSAKPLWRSLTAVVVLTMSLLCSLAPKKLKPIPPVRAPPPRGCPCSLGSGFSYPLQIFSSTAVLPLEVVARMSMLNPCPLGASLRGLARLRHTPSPWYAWLRISIFCCPHLCLTCPYAQVSAHRAFNYENIVGFDNVFQLDSTIKPYNTYAMLAHTSRFRILATFAIEDTGPSGAGPYSVEFAVLNYQQMAQVSASSGFSWEQQNSQGTSEQCNSGR